MKNLKYFIIYAVIALLTGLCASCSDVAITGRKQFNIVPDSTLNSMAATEYGQFLSENKKSTNAEQTSLVQKVGTRIANAVETYCNANGMADRMKGYNWEFNLVENDEINAWCMPGGKVVVYTGILPVTKDETGLAVVMGHEIAHAVARHGGERMSQALLIEMGGIALSEAIATRPAATQELFMQSYGIGANVGYLLPYSRLQENEADRLGLIFMAMAGYDPQAAVEFWERMASQGNAAQKPPELLSTHPADQTRINNLKNLLPEAMSYYKTSQSKAVQAAPVSVAANTASSQTATQSAATEITTKESETPQSTGSWKDIIFGPSKEK
ncbi:MAG: M48 family metallopeptidase [Sedimentisphaerales bacterium]|nr:M48 family metallopeptidase [Sedimentisphaerales bacterium]